MVSKLVLFLSLLVAADRRVDARGNIEKGLSEDYNLAYHKIHEASAIPLMKRTESIFVRVSESEKIEALRVYDLIGDSSSVIEKGGVGHFYAFVGLESARGEPFRFLVEAYAVRK